MKTTIIACLCLTFAACGGALEVPGEDGECTVLELAQNPSAPCLYQLPAGAACDGLRIYCDNAPLPEGSYTVVCGAGQVSVPDCHAGVVAACVVE